MAAIFGGKNATGGRVLIICLEERNIIALKEGRPFLSKADKNGDLDISIVYGATLRDAVVTLRKNGIALPEDIEDRVDAASGVSPAPKAVQ